MILRIKVPDEVYEAYGEMNKKNPRALMETTLGVFQDVDPRKKAITLSGEVLGQVQKALGTSVDSPESLLEALLLALQFRVDDVKVELTAAQRKKLITQAAAWKRDPEEFIATQVTENLRSL